MGGRKRFDPLKGGSGEFDPTSCLSGGGGGEEG